MINIMIVRRTIIILITTIIRIAMCLTKAKGCCESELLKIKLDTKVNGSSQFWQNFGVLHLFWFQTGVKISLLSQNSGKF